MIIFYGNRDKEIVSIIKKMYKTGNTKGHKEMFYGGYKEAYKILSELNGIIQKVDKFKLEEALYICRDLYTSVKVRKNPIVYENYADNQYIKARMCEKFKTIDREIVKDMVEKSIQFIYAHEPETQRRDEIFRFKSTMHLEAAEKNKELELQHIDDPEYGLLPLKPVFVDGFGNDRKFLNSLLTEAGEEIKYHRHGSMALVGIAGPVDIYDISKADGTEYGNIFVCNYGRTMPTRAPKGYKFR